MEFEPPDVDAQRPLESKGWLAKWVEGAGEFTDFGFSESIDMVWDFRVGHSATLAAVAMDRLILVLLAVAKFRAKLCQPGFVWFERNDGSAGHPAQLSHRTRRIITVVQAAVDDRYVE